MAKLDNYEFLVCEDGIYFGKPLKSGLISKDSRKITDAEIINMFSEFLLNYCLIHNKPLVLERNGKPFMQASIII